MTGTILVVDDEKAIVEMLVLLLESEGYRVVTARNGGEGLDQAIAERPDVVLSDVMMPVHDGLDLCRKLRADPVLRSIPLVFMTAVPEPLMAWDCPFDAYLPKPFDIEEVFATVAHLLAGADGRVPSG